MAGVRPFVRIFINDKSMDSYRVVLHHIRIAISLFVEEKKNSLLFREGNHYC